MGENIREVIFYKQYFDDFFDKQPQKVKEKLYWSINILRTVRNIPKNHLKTLQGTNGLMEYALSWEAIPIACFVFDEGRIVVLMNGFQKKTQKTPKNEIEKAL